MSACMTEQDYLYWVIGSLNLWLGANLREGGGTSPPYREWVKEFQTVFAVPTRDGTVDECTQKAMIKANHQDAGYLTWVQQSINQALGRVAVTADGRHQELPEVQRN
jgi:hypothetical protein